MLAEKRLSREFAEFEDYEPEEDRAIGTGQQNSLDWRLMSDMEDVSPAVP